MIVATRRAGALRLLSLVSLLATAGCRSIGDADGRTPPANHLPAQAAHMTLDPSIAPDAALQAWLEETDQRIGARLGIPHDGRAIGVVDVSGRRSAMVEPDRVFYGASVPKIAIVLCYLLHNPDAVAAPSAETTSELERVLKRSDNELAARYSQLVGLDRIQAMLQSPEFGFYDRVRGGIWCGKHYGIDQPRTGDPLHDHSHAATVRQCLRFYLLLEQNRLGSPALCDRLRALFAAPWFEFHDDNFVRGLKGRAVEMLRKSGLWEDWHLDTARVSHAGRVYLLAGMTQHPKGQEYLAEMAAAIDSALVADPPSLPLRHELLLHDARKHFNGTITRGRLEPAGTGVELTPAAEGEAVYESPVIETEGKFNELVLSWNVATPSGAGFCVEARVGRRADGFWSPWLYFGDWGAPPPSPEKCVKFAEGSINVDYFVSEQRFDRLQYRVRAAGIGSGSLLLDRLAICASDTSGLPDSWRPPPPVDLRPRPDAARWQRRLDVPWRSQKTEKPEIAGRICSPTSVSMVLEYRGIRRSTADVAAACFDPAHDIYGNWPRNVQAAYDLGAPGYLARFSDWDAVRRLIAAGQPLIISIRVPAEGDLPGAPYKTTDGHLLVLVGFDGAGSAEVNDPAAVDATSGQVRYRMCDLEKVWMKNTGGLAYVIQPPNKSR
ncbi:MAG: C39 family peptidase [Phycisphaerales bacterium]|nr:C39 family peptidase [Phycisphaerales bacterium]